MKKPIKRIVGIAEYLDGTDARMLIEPPAGKQVKKIVLSAEYVGGGDARQKIVPPDVGDTTPPPPPPPDPDPVPPPTGGGPGPKPGATRVPASAAGGHSFKGEDYIIEGGSGTFPGSLPTGCRLFGEGTVVLKMPSSIVRLSSRVLLKAITCDGGGYASGRALNHEAAMLLDGDECELWNFVMRNITKGAGVGVMGKNCKVFSSHFLDCGHYGLGGSSAGGFLIEDSLIARNNSINGADGCGGKFTRTVGWTGRRTIWEDNTGPGVWWDYNNGNVLLEDCISRRNKTKGKYGGNCAMAEVSQGPFKFIRGQYDGRGGNEGIFNFGCPGVEVDGAEVWAGSKGALVESKRDDNDHNWSNIGGVYRNCKIRGAIVGKWTDAGGNTKD